MFIKSIHLLLIGYFYGHILIHGSMNMEYYFPFASVIHLLSFFINHEHDYDFKTIIRIIRSLLCSGYFIYDKPHYYKYLTVLVSMLLTDTIDKFYTSKKEHYIEPVLQYFMLENQYTAYFPLLLYISNNNLILNYLIFVKADYLFTPLCYCVLWYLDVHKNENKYLCWIIIMGAHSVIKQIMENIEYIPDDFQYYPYGYMIGTIGYNLFYYDSILN
jgi:hypothetical protein